MFIPLGDNVENRSIPVAGTLLLLANLLVFAYETRLVIDGQQDRRPDYIIQFFKEYGLVPTDLEEGIYHGVITYNFIHGDFMHLLGNMVVLWAFVRTLENALGGASFFGLYMMWGVAAGIAHAVMSWGSSIPLVGASGAISGMIGAYVVAFGLRTKIKTIVWIVKPFRVDVPAMFYVGFWVMTQLAGIADSLEGEEVGIAWFCHMGGFGLGALCMLLCRNQTDRKLVLNAEGVYQFVESGAAANASTTQLATAPLGPTSREEANQCPHCKTPLSEKDRISASLLQCPNDGCRRLTYVG